jgi:hypothetical protein
LFFSNAHRLEIAAERGHQMSGAEAGHTNLYFVRVARLFQEASRSRASVFERPRQVDQTNLRPSQIRKIQVGYLAAFTINNRIDNLISSL